MHRGLAAAHTCCEMLSLELDAQKTYVWATTHVDRQAFRAMGFQVKEHARELGGFLSFSANTRNSALVDRCRSLQPLWQALSRNKGPLALRLSVLPGKFWAYALHGALSCPLAEVHISALRSQAVKALHIHKAGASSMLRLSLSGDMRSDPGFYLRWTCLSDFRRLLRRQTDILPDWKLYMQAFAGRTFPGPFSRILQVFHDLQWQILHPPQFLDHEGLLHDLLQMPEALLERVTQHAWLQLVSNKHRHRKDMCDLFGLEPTLLDLDCLRLTPLNAACLAVRSGAFISPEQHAKFDCSKTGLCAQCGVADSVQHRLCVCPRFAAVRLGQPWIAQEWDTLPRCVTHHLLPPAEDSMRALRQYLHCERDNTAEFLSRDVGSGRQHIFTDGTCTQTGVPDLNLAAWGVINASTEKILACGGVPGIVQTTPRAELTAAIAALRWIIDTGVVATIWMDALHVASGLNSLLKGTALYHGVDNFDLWQIVHSLCQQLNVSQVTVQHVPSHLDVRLCENVFEEWIAQWNQYADTTASIANACRPQSFLMLYDAARNRHALMLQKLRGLRDAYFSIAEETQSIQEGRVDEENALAAAPVAVAGIGSISDEIPVAWRRLLSEQSHADNVQFVLDVASFVVEQDANSDTCFQVSLIELVCMLTDVEVQFPVRCISTGRWVSKATSLFAETRLTAAVQLRLVRRAVRCFLRCLGLESWWIGGINLLGLGVSIPFDGLIFACDPPLLQRARQRIMDVTVGHCIRASRDLARPLF